MKNFNYFLKTGIRQNLSEETYLQAAQRKADARLDQERDLLDRLQKAAKKQIDEKGGVNKNLSKRISELENVFSSRENKEVRNAHLYDEEQKRMMRMRANDEKRLGTPISYYDEMPKAVPSVKLPTLKFKNDLEKEAYFASKSAFEAQMLGADDETLQGLYNTSIKKSAEVDAERKAGSRISPVYQVTQGDFKTATGRDYDATNPQDRQVFFDIVSRGEPTWSPTAGPGEGPAYGSEEFYTMRRRPTNIPKFETTDAWYDNKTGQLARTSPDQIAFEKEQEEKYEKGKTEELRQRAQEADKRDAASLDKPLRAQRWAMGVPGFDMDSIRREYEVRKEIERGQREKPSPKPTWASDNYKNYEPDPFAVERGQFPIFTKQEGGIPFKQTLNKAAENVMSSVGPKVSEFIKKNLAQTPPSEDYSRGMIARDIQKDLEDEGRRTTGDAIGAKTIVPNEVPVPVPLPIPVETEPMRVPDLIPIPGDEPAAATAGIDTEGPPVPQEIFTSQRKKPKSSASVKALEKGLNQKAVRPGENIQSFINRLKKPVSNLTATAGIDTKGPAKPIQTSIAGIDREGPMVPDPLSRKEREEIEFGPEVATGDIQKSMKKPSVSPSKQSKNEVEAILARAYGPKFLDVLKNASPEERREYFRREQFKQSGKQAFAQAALRDQPGGGTEVLPEFWTDPTDLIMDSPPGRTPYIYGQEKIPAKTKKLSPEERMKTQREMEDMTLDDNYDLPPDVYDLNKKVLKTPTKGKKVKEKVETLESP